VAWRLSCSYPHVLGARRSLLDRRARLDHRLARGVAHEAMRYVISVDDATQSGAFELQVETRARITTADAGVAFCTRLLDAQTRFFGARTRCEDTDPGVAVLPEAQEANCLLRYPFCSAQDLTFMNAYVDCYERTNPCLAGQESAAVESILACTMPVVAVSTSGQLSGSCRDALRR